MTFSKRLTFTFWAFEFMANYMLTSILPFQEFIQDRQEGIENNQFEYIGNTFLN